MHKQDKLYPEFVTLIQQHEKLIHKICGLYADDAEQRKDVFQEIVLQSWIAYPRFNNASKFSTWLYRVALNTAINFRRKESKHRSFSDTDNLNGLYETNENFTEEYKILYRLIHALPTLEKALMLLYLEERTHQEMAEILGLSVSNIGTKINRIKAKLKNQAIRITS